MIGKLVGSLSPSTVALILGTGFLLVVVLVYDSLVSSRDSSPRTEVAPAQTPDRVQVPVMSNHDHLAAARRQLKSVADMAGLDSISQHLEAVRASDPHNKELQRLTTILAKRVTVLYKDKKERDAGADGVGMAAQARCRVGIGGSLKAPSTAEFQSSVEDYVHYDGKFIWTVQTRVDAQNSFGARLRSLFTCKVYCEDNQSCRLTKIVEN